MPAGDRQGLFARQAFDERGRRLPGPRRFVHLGTVDLEGEAQTFQQLPPGSTDYVVYGLNNRVDYCFTVSVVYSADQVAAAPRVCTTR